MSQQSLNALDGKTVFWFEIPFYTGTLSYSIIKIDVNEGEDSTPTLKYKLNIKFEHLSINLLKELNIFFQKKIIDFLNKCQEPNIYIDANMIELPGHRDARFPKLINGTKSWDIIIYSFKSEARARLVLNSIKELLFKKFKGK